MISIRNPHVTEVWLKTDKKSTKDAQLRACRERRERRERHDEPDDTTAARKLHSVLSCELHAEPESFSAASLENLLWGCPACFFAHFSRPGSSLICIQDVCLGKWVLGLEELMMMSTKDKRIGRLEMFGTCLFFHILGIIIPTDYRNIFQRGRYTTNQQTH